MSSEADIPPAGQWVRWVTPEFGREGQVIRSAWPSMVVRWLGVDEPQVFPWAFPHFGPTGDMRVIPRPANATKVRRQVKNGSLGVDAAAAKLGTTPKRVRQRLRDGTLRGERINGRWVRVWLEEE